MSSTVMKGRRRSLNLRIYFWRVLVLNYKGRIQYISYAPQAVRERLHRDRAE